MLQIRTLENTSIGQITETFNLAFSDYPVPVVFKEEQFNDKLISEGGRLDLSVGAFDDNELALIEQTFSPTAMDEILKWLKTQIK